ncbi:TIGR03560 family F420-dependent LLM class oxidoreductase [Dictyobacter aurantiacus]|uniref:LLM class F420-dependent oxidoreductase n=1 Tax=Dictyobacter aurantiacus TaxID=1936993 RepID=A0A401ZQF8_9CHLR|nr:TIGR03560 family F420-dependent LLM class oxidoreductase [Dictyobacter aurantiacus]GCE09099.1 LLM class F420-dependent oxidoreductase [Dictyobacter aurantiacus]
MVEISIMIEGQNGLNWPYWKRLAAEVDQLGFAGLFRSDHYTNPNPPDLDSLEMIISLAYLADRTQQVHFGPLVAPVSFREPTMLARQAAAIDDLSNGRMILGLGAGWQEREHHLFGHPLGDVKTRMARFEEALEVVTRLLRSDEPVTFEGRFFQVRGATLLPRPQRPGGPRIMIGGNGIKRTLPLAARYADIWNAVFLTPADFKERSQILDTLLQQEGRQPDAVKRTVMHGLIFARDKAELGRKLDQYRQKDPEFAGLEVDELVQRLVAANTSVIGTPDQIVQQLQAYVEAGAQEIMLQWFDFEDIEGLRAFASSVLPRLSTL